MTPRIKISVAAAAAVLILVLILLFSRKSEGPASRAAEVAPAATAPSGSPNHEDTKARPRLVTVDNVAPGTNEVVSQVGCKMTPCKTPECNKCTTDNCSTHTMGCQAMTDEGDRRLCEEVYTCFTDPAHDCVNRGDPLKCWCGTNPLTCVTDNSPPTQANGVCLKQVFAAARSTDASAIRIHFMDPKSPLGLATTLVVCRGEYCTQECSVK